MGIFVTKNIPSSTISLYLRVRSDPNRSDLMATGKLFSLLMPTPPAGEDRTAPAFRAVEIRCRGASCAAAQNLRGRRFLCADAPTLPLAECDRQAHCECHYRHHDDRRRGPRRRDEIGIPPSSRQAADRRTLNGRRAEDRDCDDDDRDESDESSLLDDTYYDYMAEKFQG
jgi:hypothetical protein